MSQDEARDRYSAEAGRHLRAAVDCRFSFLPYAELVRISASWFEACAEAMLRGNYGPTEDWIRAQAKIAADQGYELDDLLQLMLECRRVAIEKEGWVVEQMETVDEIIDETLQNMRDELSWTVPEGLQYAAGQVLAAKGSAAAAAPPAQKEEQEERRIHKRAYLKLPVRVRGWIADVVVETVQTDNVSRGGIRFETRKNFPEGQTLQIIYPFRVDSPEVDQEMPGRIVRIDKRHGRNLVAVQFLVDLNTGKPLPNV